MDKERLQWITKKATLDAYEIKVRLSSTPGPTIAHVWAAGTCERRRGYLWTHTEDVPVEHARYSLHDLLIHISMVCEQDRPTSNLDFTRAMIGSAWDQPELPF